MSEPLQVTVARIGRAHGIRGDVAVELRTDEPERRLADGATLLTDRGIELTIQSQRWHSGRLLVHFRGVDDRTAAEGLRGTELSAMVPADELPEGEDEYYDRQLVGLTAKVAGEDRVLGPVTEVVHLPAQDLLVIDLDGQERWIPFVSELVPSIDLAAGTLEVVDQPGLLEDLDDEGDDEPAQAGGSERTPDA